MSYDSTTFETLVEI